MATHHSSLNDVFALKYMKIHELRLFQLNHEISNITNYENLK